MALQPAYQSISSLSNSNGELKKPCDTSSLYLLLDIFTNTEVKTKIDENKCGDVWDFAKKLQIVNSDLDSLRAIYSSLKIDCNSKTGYKYTNSTPLLTLFQDLMEYVSPQMRTRINGCKQFHDQLELLRLQFVDSRSHKNIIVSKHVLLKKADRVEKLLGIFKDADLTALVNREHLYGNKNAILWNHAKFHYSNAFTSGPVLNDDVVSLIKQFIPTETRMSHLRLRYTDKWLTEGLMKKTKKQLKLIITYINTQYFLTRTLDWRNAITLSGNKGEQVLKIVNEFSKIDTISRGGSFTRKVSGKNVSTFSMMKDVLPEYKKATFNLFLLLVSIVKNPSKKKKVVTI